MDLKNICMTAYEAMKDLPLHWYLAVTAMLIEEKCKAEGVNALEMFGNLYESAKSVNEMLRDY